METRAEIITHDIPWAVKRSSLVLCNYHRLNLWIFLTFTNDDLKAVCIKLLLCAALFMLYQMQGHHPHLTESSQRSNVRRQKVHSTTVHTRSEGSENYIFDRHTILNSWKHIFKYWYSIIYALSNATSAESSWKGSEDTRAENYISATASNFNHSWKHVLKYWYHVHEDEDIFKEI